MNAPLQSASKAPAVLPADTRSTVAGLRRELLAGRDPVPGLQALRTAALQAAGTPSGHGVWIHLCDDATWQAQIDTLRRRLADHPSVAHALERHPLLGVPFALKDNIDVAGQPTTAACPDFSHRPDVSATVVQRLLDAGALWLGKTNLDQFATGLVGTRSPYGRPACVADASRISGGSSSGSAVAVARGWVAFALGTDTAGSGRIPAGFNGLVGLKPTPGRVSTFGVLPACRTLDCVSIFAHSVDDAAQVLSVIEGPDDADPYSDHRAGPDPWPPRLKVGVPIDPVWTGDAGYAPCWTAALARLRAAGHEAVPVDFTLLREVAALLYDGPWVAERHAVIADLLARRPQAIDPTVRQVVSRATAFSATDTFRAQYRLRELQRQAASLWRTVDLLLVPTAPGHPRFREIDADPVGANAALGAYTNFVNLLGWCALALPAGTTDAGLPFGVTAIAPGHADAALVGAGRALAAALQPELTQGAAPPDPAAVAATPASTGATAAMRVTPAPALDLAPAPASATVIAPVPAPAPAPASGTLAWPCAPADTLPIAVVGAHLSGLPLNPQLTSLGATLIRAAHTAAHYRLYELPGTVPPKPGMVRCPGAGAAIEVEVWALPLARVGAFLAAIPAPLGIGQVELDDGTQVHGFLCESHAVRDAIDITAHGGWRRWLAHRTAAAAAPR